MLEALHIVGSGNFYCFSEDKMICHYNNLCRVDIVELSSGLVENSFQPFDLPSLKEEISTVSVCGSKLLYFFKSGNGFIYGIDKSLPLSNFVIPKIRPQQISHICPSRNQDNIFFVSYNNGSTLRALYCSSAGTFVSPIIRLDAMVDRSKEPINSMKCHPSKPLLFISNAKGSVQVWNYSNLKKQLISALGDSSGSNGAGEGGGNDHNENDNEDAVDSSSKSGLLPVALITPPFENAKTVVGIDISFDGVVGKICSILWRGFTSAQTDTVCAYDIRNCFLNRNANDKVESISPVGMFSMVESIGKCIGMICLHPKEPILFAVCQTNTGCSILELTLLDNTMRIISTQALEYIPIGLYCTPFGGNVVISKKGVESDTVVFPVGGDANVMDTSLAHLYTLSRGHSKSHTWFTPIVNVVNIPPDAYIDSDGVMCIKEAKSTQNCTAAANGWPLLLALQVDADFPAVGNVRKAAVKLLTSSFHLFRLRISMSTHDPTPPMYIGEIPSIVPKPPTDTKSLWISFPLEDNAVEGIFCPDGYLAVNDICRGAMCESGVWEAVIRGNSLSYGKGDDISLRSLTSSPCVCFVRYTSSCELNIAFGGYRDACFWSGNSVQVLSTVDKNNMQWSPTLLALTKTGTQVALLSLSPTSSDINSLFGSAPFASSIKAKPTRVDLTIAMSNMWTSPVGCPNVILYASLETNAAACQTLYVTTPGSLIVDTSVASKKFKFLEAERVISLLWQSQATVANSTSAEKNILRHQVWNNTSGPLIGLLTSHRVMILSSTLTMISCYWYNGQVRKESPYVPKDRALCIMWTGRTLCFVTESGGVQFLLPVPIDSLAYNKTIVNSPSLSCKMFTTFEHYGNVGRLCTLPRHHVQSQCVRLIACLPDRLLYSALVDTNKSSRMSVLMRPCLPLEPLVLGLLQKNSAMERYDLTTFEFKYSLIESLILAYVPAKQLPGASSENGALPSTQCTRRLCIALSESGFEGLALIVAGVCINSHTSVGSDFPRNRWISPGLKFHLSIRAGKFAEACNELLTTRPELQELFIDPESYGGGTLPHKSSTYATQYSAAALLLTSFGQFELARKLADIAGDDLLVALLLQAEESERNGDLDGLARALESKKGSLSKIVKLYLGKDDTLFVSKMDASAVGGTDRRSALLPLSSTLLGVPSTLSHEHMKANVDLAAMDKLQKQHMTHRGGGLGPVTKLGILAMDSVEDWVGKSKLEIINLDTVDRLRLAREAGSNVATSNDTTTGDEFVKPDTWVEEVGVGKEWDKVSLYCRFSDILRPGEEGFMSSGYPSCRIGFVDLSKFSCPLELFSDQTLGRMNIEISTSAVDPGEDHEKVKCLNDIVFQNESLSVEESKGLTYGLRTVIGRGSQLDVGMFHEDPNRNKLTIELSVFRSEEAAKLGQSSKVPTSHCLVKRCIGLPSLDAQHINTVMWSLNIESNGALSMTVGKSAKSTIKTEVNEVNMGPTEAIPVSVWTQVAAVIETVENTASITLYVNGNKSANGKVTITKESEETLKYTTMYVGHNLSGWRISELRVWADARPQIDIEGMRENYLPLASKRKRMQFRIKGSKKLFGPLPDSFVIGEPDTNAPKIPGTQSLGPAVNEDDSQAFGSSFAAPASVALSGPVDAPLKKSVGGRRSSLAAGDPSISAGFLSPPSNDAPVASPATSGLTPPPTSSGLMMPPPSAGVKRGGLAPPGGGLAPPGAPRGLMMPPSEGGGGDRPKRGQLSAPLEKKAEEVLPAAVVEINVPIVEKPELDLKSEVKTPEVPATVSIVEKVEDLNQAKKSSVKPVAFPPPSTGGLSAPPEPIAVARKQRRSSMGASVADLKAFSFASSSIVNVESTKGSEDKEKSMVTLGASVASAGVTIADFLKCIRSRPVGHGSYILTNTQKQVVTTSLAIDGNTPVSKEEEIVILKVQSLNDDQLEEKNSSSGDIDFKRYPLSAETAVVSPRLDMCLVAYYKAKKITVVNLDTNVNILELPMAAPLVFWKFYDDNKILLVTNQSAFTWNVENASGRPVKIFDRNDIKDPKK